VGAVSRPRKAGGRRPQRQIQLPARYSHEYPVETGHNYLVRSIPLAIWARARKRALAEQRAIRGVVIRALELYAAGRLSP
jgi:hypothetical protein